MNNEVPTLAQPKKDVAVAINYEFLEDVLDLDTSILRDRLDALAFRGTVVEGFIMDDEKECLIISGPNVMGELQD